MLAYHRTANLHWLLHMVNDHCAFISIFAVPNFTSNVFFFATAHQGYREHISWTARCTAISWEEARGHFGYSRVPRQEQQSEGRWSEGIWKWPEQQRRKRWGLPPPQWRQPCQGPLQESRLTSCPVPSDTYLLLSSLAEWKPGDLSVYWNFFCPIYYLGAAGMYYQYAAPEQCVIFECKLCVPILAFPVISADPLLWVLSWVVGCG